MSDYHILDAVSEVPPRESKAHVRHPGWLEVYVIAEQAAGAWVPVVFSTRADAKRLGAAAQKHPAFDAEVRGTLTYIRLAVRR